MARLFKDTEGYISRRARLNSAIEHYYTDTVGDNDNGNLEELMLASYDLMRHTKDNVGVPMDWGRPFYVKSVNHSIIDVADAMTKGYSLPYEVGKLEGVSRSIYEYLKRNGKKQRTM